MSEWEEVDEVPRKDIQQFSLKPGQIMRQKASGNRAGTMNTRFKARGITDYHACQRKVNGEVYIYVWRDAE